MTHSFYRYVLAGMITVLGACNVSKDLSVAPASLPDSFRNAGITDTTTAADIPWSSFFTDGTLKGLIDKAIHKNYDMQIALKNIEAAQLTLRQSKWGYAPDARIDVSAGINRPSDNSLNGLSLAQVSDATHIEDYSASLVLSWQADIWGKVKNQKRSALAAYLQTEEARKLIQTDIVSGVSKGFYNLLMLDAQLQVAKKNLALNDSTIRIMHLQFEAGQITSLAIQQAEAQRLKAAQLVPQFEQNISIQENALSILAGESPSATERSIKIEELAFTDKLATGVPGAMVSRRPDVKSSELSLTIANANAGITRANMYPTLTITGSGGVNAFKASNWFNIPASLFGTIAGGLSQPLLLKKQLRTRYELAIVEREKTVILFRQTVLNAVGEVSDALVRLEKLKSQYEAVETRVTTLQQATSNAGLLFQSGMANYLEVITAQSNVLQSELDLALLRRDRLSAAVDLYTALGGGWQ